MNSTVSAAIPEEIEDVTARILRERPEGLKVAAKLMNVSTMQAYRYATLGSLDGEGNRVFLETIRCGRTLKTSVAAIHRYIRRLTAASPARPAAPLRTPSRREKDSAKAASYARAPWGSNGRA